MLEARSCVTSWSISGPKADLRSGAPAACAGAGVTGGAGLLGKGRQAQKLTLRTYVSLYIYIYMYICVCHIRISVYI